MQILSTPPPPRLMSTYTLNSSCSSSELHTSRVGMCCNSHMVLHVSSNCIVRQGGGLGRDSPPLGLDAREGRLAGEHVDPRQWNALLQDPDVLVIDTRNEDEICVGTFRNAVDPKTQPRASCGEARWLTRPPLPTFSGISPGGLPAPPGRWSRLAPALVSSLNPEPPVGSKE